MYRLKNYITYTILVVIIMRKIKKIDKYSCCIFNNCYYKFLNNKINIYDNCVNKINEVEDCYRYFCFYNNSYYAIKKNDYKNIYILNNLYEKTNKIQIKIIVDNIISFTILNDYFYLLFENKIIKLDMMGNYVSDVLFDINNICEIKPRVLKNLNFCCINQNIKKINLTSIGVYNNFLIVSFIKNNASYYGYLINDKIENIEFVCDNSKIISIIEKNKSIEFLICKYDSYTYLIYDNKCCFNKEHNCKKDNDIIDSIACIEYSIADLIKAESIKIENSLKKTDEICKIIKLNNSATKMIRNITLLETVLVGKLEIILENNNVK